MSHPVETRRTSTRSAAQGRDPGGRWRRPEWRRHVLRDELGVVIVLVALVARRGRWPPAVPAPATCSRPRRAPSYVGLMAFGMVFPLAMREVDLSVGGNYALGIVRRRDADARRLVNPWLAALALLVACAAVSAPSTALSRPSSTLPSFIVTLATALLFRGPALALADGKQIAGLPQDSAFFDSARRQRRRRARPPCGC